MREPELCWGCWWMEVCTSRGGREKIQASKGFCGSKVSKERTESTEGSRDTSRGSRNSGWVRDSERNAISKKHLGCRKGSPSQAVWRMRFSYYLPFPLLAPVLAWLTPVPGPALCQHTHPSSEGHLISSSASLWTLFYLFKAKTQVLLYWLATPLTPLSRLPFKIMHPFRVQIYHQDLLQTPVMTNMVALLPN